MLTKQNVIDSFTREYVRQKNKKIFIEDELVKYTNKYVICDLSDEDKLYITNYINKNIFEYKSYYNTINNTINNIIIDYTISINNIYYSSLISNYINSNSNYYNYNSSLVINNYLVSITSDGILKDLEVKIDKGIDNEDVIEESIEKINSTFPTLNFIKSSNIRYVPSKVQRVLDKYISTKELKKIDDDVETAKEYCLLFLSMFAKAYYFEYKDSWTYMSKYNCARRIFGNDGSTARKKLNILIDVLATGSKDKGGIIEINKEVDFSFVKRLSNEYRLTECYRNKGFVKYELKTKKAINVCQKNYYSHLSNIMDNDIVKNLFQFYSRITLPTEEQIIKRAKELVKESYMKHNKHLKFRNKKAKELDNTNKFIYVEDSIEIFNYLTSDGLLLPNISEEKAGGRVSDSFNLMPSWIRSLVKIDNKKIEEFDYSCLHPNIAMTLYNGSKKYLTHQQVSDESGLDRTTVKIEHLSFFNRSIQDMKNRPLYGFYMAQEHDMMVNLMQEKLLFGYKETSKKMFTLEVQIMNDVIKQLNAKYIYVMYIYDAIACQPKYTDTVVSIMNETILKYGVYTNCHK